MADFELIDIVDINNKVVGTSNAKTAHEKKLMHRIIGVFVFDNKGKIYVQKENKYRKIDLSVGGHVQKGESYDNAARREMLEEIGLTTPLVHISTFLPKNARLNHYWSIYETIAPPDWIFKKTEEVKLLEKMRLEDVISMMRINPDLFTHGFINAVEQYTQIKKYYEMDKIKFKNCL